MKSLPRYTSDWSSRIETLRKTLAKEPRISVLKAPVSVPEQNDPPALDRIQTLSEQLKRFQESLTHEIRQISMRCQELEAFVESKEIDLQNLKSDAVKHQLIHEDLKNKIAEQSGDAAQTAEGIEQKILQLTEQVRTLQALSTPQENSSNKSFFSRWLEWWNKPLVHIPISKAEAPKTVEETKTNVQKSTDEADYRTQGPPSSQENLPGKALEFEDEEDDKSYYTRWLLPMPKKGAD